MAMYEQRHRPIEAVRVMISEAQQIFREGLSRVLQAESSIRLVGVTPSLQEAIDVLAVGEPDVLVVGLSADAPGATGQLETAMRACPDLGMVIMGTGSIAARLPQSVPRAGRGVAYLLKENVDTADELTRVIRAVAEGKVVYDPAVIREVVEEESTGALGCLTRRELEVVERIASGFKNRAIAGMFGLEIKTVEHHINNIFGKMGLEPDCDRHARVQAVLAFLNATGRLRPPPDEIQAEAAGNGRAAVGVPH